MGYVDTKEFAKAMREQAVKDGYGRIVYSVELWELITEIFDSQPTADVVEVKHGKWVINRYPVSKKEDYNCSICSFASNNIDILACNYCPNCGAKMDIE